MALRLAVVFLAVFLFACGGSGGGGTTTAPGPQWGRARADNSNSGISATSITNLGGNLLVNDLKGGPIRSTPSIGFDGTVFVAAETGGIFALNGDTLATIWQFPTNGILGKTNSTPALDGFNNSFFATENGWVVSLDPDGQLLWMTDLSQGGTRPTSIAGSPLLFIDLVENDVEALFLGTSDGRIMSLGGQDGQVRWTYKTGGAVKASVIFDGLTLYAPSSDGLMYFLTQRGSGAFPPAPLGALEVDFSASPSLFAQALAQPGLAGTDGGRVRGVTTNSTSPLWDREFPAPIRTSPAQFQRVLVQELQNSNGSFTQTDLVVTDYVVVDAAGTGWLLDSQIGTLGARCIDGPDDLLACRRDEDCQQYTEPNLAKATCQPPYWCVGGDDDGEACRPDNALTGSNGCAGTGAVCAPLFTCVAGTNAGKACVNDGGCPGSACNQALFAVNEKVEVAPATTTEGTIFVVTAPALGGSKLYAIEPPTTKVPVEGLTPCLGSNPRFCRFFVQAQGAIQASPAVGANGLIYFGDDTGTAYVVTGAL